MINKILSASFLIITILITIVIWCMASWALGLKDYAAPELMIFLGRFHPLVLHLPIGFMVLACLLEVLTFAPRSMRSLVPKSTALYGLVFLSASVAVIHGILLFASGGYEESELARRHLVGGCLFLSVVAVIFLIKLQLPKIGEMRLVALGLSFVSMAVMGISSHDGASLTHGENYLSQYAPEPLKPLLEPGYEPKEEKEEEISFVEQNIYEVAVQPIFDRTCVECHKESKKKGKLRMDSYEELLKGGASGDAFVAGNVKKSYLLERIHLPLDDEEHMPPEGKKQPTEEEIAVLTWWVEIGAPAEGSLASFSPSESILNAVTSWNNSSEDVDVSSTVIPETSSVGAPLAPLDRMAIADFNQNSNGRLQKLSEDQELLVFTAFSEPKEVNDEVLGQLTAFAPYLYDLNLSRDFFSRLYVERFFDETTRGHLLC